MCSSVYMSACQELYNKIEKKKTFFMLNLLSFCKVSKDLQDKMYKISLDETSESLKEMINKIQLSVNISRIEERILYTLFLKWTVYTFKCMQYSVL